MNFVGMRICHICQAVIGARVACPVCTERFGRLEDVDAMSPEERAAELALLIGVLEIPFDLLHQRVERLVGRPVWTRELGHPKQLLAEIQGGRRTSLSDVFGQLLPDAGRGQGGGAVRRLNLETIDGNHAIDPVGRCWACGYPHPCDTAQLVARVRALEAALARLVETEPVKHVRIAAQDRDYESDVCAYCETLVDHLSACPWRQARELLMGGRR